MYIIVGLLLLNIVTVCLLLSKHSSLASQSNNGAEESVATIGNDSISREEWLLAMEKQYGKDVLQQLVNEKVVEKMAKKYGINVSKKEINQEFMLIKSVHENTDQELIKDEDLLKRKIKSSLLLEKLLTKDVKVSENQIEKYFNDNQQLYNIPTTYLIYQIVTKNKEEAEKVISELKDGSDFQALAMEKSIDSTTSPHGGEVGYITEESQSFPDHYLETVKSLHVNDISEAIPYNNEYAVVWLKEKTEGASFSFNDVKEQIRRQIALESLETPITPEAFWKEAKVKWFYGKDK